MTGTLPVGQGRGKTYWFSIFNIISADLRLCPVSRGRLTRAVAALTNIVDTQVLLLCKVLTDFIISEQLICTVLVKHNILFAFQVTARAVDKISS